jgi:hypothetical protein
MLLVAPEDVEAFAALLWFPDAAVGKCNRVRKKTQPVNSAP